MKAFPELRSAQERWGGGAGGGVPVGDGKSRRGTEREICWHLVAEGGRDGMQRVRGEGV